MSDILWNRIFFVTCCLTVIWGLLVVGFVLNLLWFLIKGPPGKRCKDCSNKAMIKGNPSKTCYWLLLNRYHSIDICKHYKRKRWKFWRPK